MRFSLKRLLAGTAYAAVAAAALTQDSWIWADIVWALSLVAFAFAIVVSCLARGPRQAAALGFVAFSACFLACLQFAESSVPTSRLLLAWRLGSDNVVLSTIAPFGSSSPNNYPLVRRDAAGRLRYFDRRYTGAPADLTDYVRAGNAMATMGFGLLGCLLAPLALRAAGREGN